ncbi:hypothetical protein QQX98_013339 [Neonectria punicea]|uniref:Uncharacterized protein n=1 Tax=Neonectria punicea TaxID=979145 RepID=A0ABR1GGC1_9HYPO
MEELEKLRQQLREAEHRALKEQQRREAAEGRALEEQHQREEAQRRREEAEELSSELGLRNSQRDVVENAVQKLVGETYNDLSLRSRLGLHGTITFESHTNLGNADESLSESMEQMSIGTDGSGATTTQLPRPPNRAAHRRKARGKGNRAD